MNRVRAGRFLLGLAVLLALASDAGAHAFLERGDPRVGSTVEASPERVRLSFTQELEAPFCTLQVLNEAGERVDRGDAEVDPDDAIRFSVSLLPLPPGVYRVVWRVLSVDTHVTEGDYRFRVEPE